MHRRYGRSGVSGEGVSQEQTNGVQEHKRTRSLDLPLHRPRNSASFPSNSNLERLRRIVRTRFHGRVGAVEVPRYTLVFLTRGLFLLPSLVELYTSVSLAIGRAKARQVNATMLRLGIIRSEQEWMERESDVVAMRASRGGS